LGIGLLMVVSATYGVELHRGLYLKQSLYAVLGLLVMYTAARVPTRLYEAFAPLLYVVSLALLALTLVVGHVGMGAQRWLGAGPRGAARDLGGVVRGGGGGRADRVELSGGLSKRARGELPRPGPRSAGVGLSAAAVEDRGRSRWTAGAGVSQGHAEAAGVSA